MKKDPIQKAFLEKMKKAGVTAKAIILESAAGEVIKVDPISAAYVRMMSTPLSINESFKPLSLDDENVDGGLIDGELIASAAEHADGSEPSGFKHGNWAVFHQGHPDGKNSVIEAIWQPLTHNTIVPSHLPDIGKGESHILAVGPKSQTSKLAKNTDAIKKELDDIEAKKKPFTPLSINESTILTEDRIDFLKNQYRDKLSTKHDPDAEHTNSDDIINHLSEGGDPTKKKIYSQWLINQYRNSSLTPEEAAARGVSKIPHFKQEDVGRSYRVLGNFDKYKSKLDKKDINQYADLNELQTAVAPHLGTAVSKKEAVKTLNHPGLSKEWEDEHINLYHLKTKEASQELFGGGSDAGKTDWCTADTRDQYNAWDTYTKGGHRLWVVQHKPTGKLYQYQVKDAQFMNNKDEPASNNMEEYNAIIPSLHKAWKENDKFIDGDIEDDGHH